MRDTIADYRKHPLQVLLCLAGIALGVAVAVAIDVANQSALESMRENIESVSGRATHQIVSTAGMDIPEQMLPQVQNIPGVTAAAPVIEQNVEFEEAPAEPLRLLGTDVFLDADLRAFNPRKNITGNTDFPGFLTRPNAILLSRDFANRQHLREQQVVHALVGTRRVPCPIVGLITESAAANDIALMDIASAQDTFGKRGVVDRIDLIANARAAEEIVRILPAGLMLETPQSQIIEGENVLQSFRMNLTALSFLALFVGTFLIFNTLSFSVIRRRNQIGLLRAIGATRSRIAARFLGEAALLGLIGGALGLLGGIALSHYTIRAVAGTVNELYVRIGTPHFVINPWLMLKALGLGIGASFCAAAVPAWEAAHVPPVSAMKRSQPDVRLRRWAPFLAIAGFILLLIAGALCIAPGSNLAAGFAAAFFVCVGFGLMAPAAALVFVRVNAAILERTKSSMATMALRNITASLSRTGPALAALSVCLAMTIGISLMVGSFRQSLIDWIGRTIQADIYIQPAGRTDPRTGGFLPPEFIDSLSRHPDIADVDVLRRFRAEIGGSSAVISAVRFDLVARRAHYKFIEGSQSDAFAQLQHRDAVIISETLRSRSGLHKDATLRLVTPTGPRDFKIAGVYRDYSVDGGQVLMDRTTYLNLWNDPRVNNAALYLKPGTNTEEALARLQKQFATQYNVRMSSTAKLRTDIIGVFDRTFAITHVLELLAVVVAAFGIVAALLALLLERRKELATLRAIGMSRGQLARMLCVESVGIGTIAVGIAWAAGVCLALVLIYVINVRCFGWTIEPHFRIGIFAVALGVAVFASLASAVYPLLQLRRFSLAEALRED